MAKKELTAKCFLIQDEKIIEFNKLNSNEKKKISERLSGIMSDYYSHHLDEFERI